MAYQELGNTLLTPRFMDAAQQAGILAVVADPEAIERIRLLARAHMQGAHSPQKHGTAYILTWAGLQEPGAQEEVPFAEAPADHPYTHVDAFATGETIPRAAVRRDNLDVVEVGITNLFVPRTGLRLAQALASPPYYPSPRRLKSETDGWFWPIVDRAVLYARASSGNQPYRFLTQEVPAS
jgi:hypothetical protein